MFKKFLSAALILSVAASLSACSSSKDIDITFKRKTTEYVQQESESTEITEADTTEPETEATSEEQTTEPEEESAAEYAVYEAVNVRANPDYNSQILGTLSYGETVSVSSFENGWAVIDYNGTQAYVSGDYLNPLS